MTTVDWSSFIGQPAAPVSAVLIGIGTIAAGTGIGWSNSGADMARYQHRSVSAGKLVATAACGAGIPLVLVIGLGSILAAGDSSISQAADPVAAVRTALPAWVSVPYLIAAFAGLLLSNHLSVYSAGLTTITLGVRIPRVYAVIVDVVVTTAGALYFMLGSSGFYGPFVTFISLMAIPITAWAGIFLVDLLRRPRYDGDSLLELNSSSRYWYTGGINWVAFGSWIVALAIGFCFDTARVSEDVTWFSGPFAHTAIGENGLAWVVSLLLGGALYAFFGWVAKGSAGAVRARAAVIDPEASDE